MSTFLDDKMPNPFKLIGSTIYLYKEPIIDFTIRKSEIIIRVKVATFPKESYSYIFYKLPQGRGGNSLVIDNRQLTLLNQDKIKLMTIVLSYLYLYKVVLYTRRTRKRNVWGRTLAVAGYPIPREYYDTPLEEIFFVDGPCLLRSWLAKKVNAIILAEKLSDFDCAYSTLLISDFPVGELAEGMGAPNLGLRRTTEAKSFAVGEIFRLFSPGAHQIGAPKKSWRYLSVLLGGNIHAEAVFMLGMRWRAKIPVLAIVVGEDPIVFQSTGLSIAIPVNLQNRRCSLIYDSGLLSALAEYLGAEF